MPKNIVILLDGTSNEISANRTNVLRLYGTLEKSERQLVYYDPGVGTFGAEDSWFKGWRKVVEVWGLLTGWGLDKNVKEAYRFLVETYDHGKDDETGAAERDRIYIFGFSRGAYSARMLAGFINAIGLIEKRNLNLVDYAYSAYKRIGEGQEESRGDDEGKRFAEVRLYERMLRADRPPVRLLGLFDTVASVIELRGLLPTLRFHAFTKTNPSVESVRHAVAIDERRTMFRPQLWPDGEEYRGNPFNKAVAKLQDVREVWFTGFHGNVGGGHPEKDSGLAKVPLAWLIEQTKPMGLHYKTRTVNEIVLGTNPNKDYVAPDPNAETHDPMTWGWALLECMPRRRPKDSKRAGLFGLIIPYFERRSIPEKALIHQSVVDRSKTSGELPPNLPSSYRTENGVPGSGGQTPSSP